MIKFIKKADFTFIGIFFMALTLAIVSFSCTGPILGSLLAGSLTSEGGAFQLSIGMLGFGLALGLPFGLLAIFPNSLKKFPKSGVKDMSLIGLKSPSIVDEKFIK